MKDKEIKKLIEKEVKRQKGVINLIASENYISDDVRTALGSVLTNKYAEGYPNTRYYGGNTIVDEIEELAQERARKLFDLDDTWSVNVQPYSGSPANLAVYSALVPVHETIMAMQLDMGGHLTHGHSVSMTGKLWNFVHYGVRKDNELIDYDAILKEAKRVKPKLIVAGVTAYSRFINFEAFRNIADEVGALFMVDMSHVAGLVAGGVYPSPFTYRADVVTTTVHKTLRGPRSALIFSKNEHAKKIDKAVFPGLQGGPHVNQIAATAIALKEANTKSFQKYIEQVVMNTRVLAESLATHGWKIVSGGTDTHLFLMDTMKGGVSGKDASDILEQHNIIVNKNTIPYDTRSPQDPSGIRIGTAAVTTQGMGIDDMKMLGSIIHAVLIGDSSRAMQAEIKKLIKTYGAT